MKRTYKNRKYKKRTNKRRKSVKNSKKNSKKIKGGDSVDIVAYKSLIKDKDSRGADVDLFNYKIISKRDFPETIVDTIIYQPWRDVEESIAEINESIGLNKTDFEKYPDPEKPEDRTTIEIKYDKDRLKKPTVTSPSP
jgi:hypothetical protein